MRRTFTLVLAVVALLGFMAPAAFAQAPTPKVTITGLVDNLASFSRNQGLNASDRNTLGLFTNPQDKEFYSRTRGRFDIVGELGKGKAVLGLELDCVYGATGTSNNSNLGKQVSAGFRPDGSGCTFGADNDVTGAIEIKWMYVEAPATGPGSLLPFVPIPGIIRMGGQPYALGLKPSILADSDFGGWTYIGTISPTLKFQLTYAQLEERSSGVQNGFFRGDDWGLILKVDVNPLKELRVSPIATYQQIAGTTAALFRRATGGYGVSGSNFAPDQAAASIAGVASGGSPAAIPATGTATICGSGVHGATLPVGGRGCRAVEENRFIVGLDADYRSGPWYFNPTFFYNFGNRQRLESSTDPGVRVSPNIVSASESAWIVDLQGGYQWGALNLESRALYTTGNQVGDNLNRGTIRSYQTFQTGNSYWIGWGEAHTIGNIDYLQSFAGFSNSFSETGNIGYDRYGRAQVSFRGRYAVTPQFSVYGIVTPIWTAEGIPTSRVTPSSTGLLCVTDTGGGVATATRPCDRRDQAGSKHNYIGTDLTAGITWKFAPGFTFDYVFGYLIAGNALDNLVDRGASIDGSSCVGNTAGGCFQRKDARDTYVTTGRIRYEF